MLVEDTAELEKGVAQEDFGRIRVCEVSEFKECEQISKILWKQTKSDCKIFEFLPLQGQN